MAFLNKQIIIKFLIKHHKRIQKVLKYFMLFVAIGWVSHSLFHWILVTDEKVEAAYPTMNQDFGVLVSYLVGKILRTVGYLITVIPGGVYGILPLPKGLGWVVLLQTACGASWIGIGKLVIINASNTPSLKVPEEDPLANSPSKFDFRTKKHRKQKRD